MRYERWEPNYLAILEYFGFDRALDEEAARILSSLLRRDDLPLLAGLCRGHHIMVCGNAPCLKNQLAGIKSPVFAADAAADVLYDRGIRPDAIFTDLDGATDRFIEMDHDGTIIVVHAHGDNMALLRHWVPRFGGPVVGTTQSTPLAHVHNFGGLTDGDRAVFAADDLGASGITILGFDLDDQDVDPVKRGKLFWARQLLGLIGYEC